MNLISLIVLRPFKLSLFCMCFICVFQAKCQFYLIAEFISIKVELVLEADTKRGWTMQGCLGDMTVSENVEGTGRTW